MSKISKAVHHICYDSNMLLVITITIIDLSGLLLISDPHSPFAQVAVSDLVESLKPTGNALVGRYVWREPHPPKMVLLSPGKRFTLRLC